MNAIIIHGSYGSPEENWIPWLKEELEKRGFSVFAPRFPTPEGQSLEAWDAAFSPFEKYLDGNAILVGHSLGVTFILRLLERINSKVKACFFSAGFVGLLGDPKFDEINKTFVEKPFNWAKIRQNSGSFTLFHSDNDPYVAIENAEEIANGLGIEPAIVKGAGHFNSSAGFTQFPQLLEKILAL